MTKEKSPRIIEAWKNSKSEYHNDIVDNLIGLQARLRERASRAAQAWVLPERPGSAAPAPDPAAVQAGPRRMSRHRGKQAPAPSPTATVELPWAPEDWIAAAEQDLEVIDAPAPAVEAHVVERVRDLEEGTADLADSVTAVYAEVGEQIVDLRKEMSSEVEDLRGHQDEVEARIREVLVAHRDQIRRILDEHFAAMRKAVETVKEEARIDA